MNYIIKLHKQIDNTKEFEISYLKTLDGEVTDDRTKALLIKNDTELNRIRPIVRKFCLDSNDTYYTVISLLEDDYSCLIRITEKTEEKTERNTIRLFKEDLKSNIFNKRTVGEDHYDSPYQYCSNLVKDYLISDTKYLYIKLEYSEDGGNSWTEVYEDGKLN